MVSDRVRRATAAALAVVLVLAVLATAGVTFLPPRQGAEYTEFYVLGPGGTASNYPTDLAKGETGHVILGVSNHYSESRTYTVVAVLDGEPVGRRTVTVPPAGTWQGRMAVTPTDRGRQRLRFLLYAGHTTDGRPIRYLRLWIDVG